MTQRNVYVTLAEYKAHVTSPGSTLATDTADDGAVETILERVSRFIDGRTRHTFYPAVDTLYFDLPDDNVLHFTDDVLAVSSLLNGDGTSIASTEYRLLDRNRTPYTSLALNASSSTSFTYDAYSNTEQVIALTATTGYRSNYAREAWRATGATLSAAISSTSALTFACTTGKITAGMILKIDDEILIASSVSTGATDTVTVYSRGDNGSTAATHLISVVIYQWITQPDVAQAAMEIAVNAVHRRFGQNMSGTSSTTPSGVVIGPQDLTEFSRVILENYTRHV